MQAPKIDNTNPVLQAVQGHVEYLRRGRSQLSYIFEPEQPMRKTVPTCLGPEE